MLDGERGLGNGHLLPAGPLREPAARLRSVDAIVVNGGDASRLSLPPGVPCFRQTLAPGAFYRAANPADTRQAQDFAAEQRGWRWPVSATRNAFLTPCGAWA